MAEQKQKFESQSFPEDRQVPGYLEMDYVTNKLDRIRHTQAIAERTFREYVDDLKRIDEAENAYFSDSWPERQKRARKAAGKPTGDIARFAPIVDTISGTERQNRSDEYAFAFDEDAQFAADVVNLYLKYRRRSANLAHMQSQQFQAGIVTGRFHTEYTIESSQDGTFQVRAIDRDPREVFILKPFRNYDASDSDGLIHAQWVSLNYMKELYAGENIDWTLVDWHQHPEMLKEHTRVGDNWKMPDDSSPQFFYDKEKNLVRLIRFWEKRCKNRFRVVNLVDPEGIDNLVIGEYGSRAQAHEAAISYILSRQPDLPDERIAELAKSMVAEYTREYYSYHVISGRLELEWEEDAGDFIPWVHFFAYYVNGKFSGIFERVRDEIREANFIHAKLMERLGTLGKMPIGIEQGAVANIETAIKQYQKSGVMVFKDNALRQGKFKEFRDPTLEMIAPYITLLQHYHDSLKQKTGVNDPLQGQAPGANMAGVAIDLLQRKGATLIEPLLDNYGRTRTLAAKLEIRMLSEMFKARPYITLLKVEKIVKGIIPDMQGDPRIKEFAQALQDPEKEAVRLENILQKLDQAEYDFALDNFSSSPTMRMATLQIMAGIAQQAGIPLPPQLVIAMAELPQKYKDMWQQSLAQQQAALSQGTQGQPDVSQILQAIQAPQNGAVTDQSIQQPTEVPQ